MSKHKHADKIGQWAALIGRGYSENLVKSKDSDSYNYRVIDIYPLWLNNSQYLVAVDVIDDVPVFEGDIIYDKDTGDELEVKEWMRNALDKPHLTINKPEDKITLRCEHLVNIKSACDNIETLVLFKPSDDTVDAIYEWHEDVTCKNIEVYDKSGHFVKDESCVPVLDSDIIYEYGTLVIEVEAYK